MSKLLPAFPEISQPSQEETAHDDIQRDAGHGGRRLRRQTVGSMHAEMIKIRSFEGEAKALCFGGGVRGCTHLCQGRKLLFQ
jgi:TPP-dependent pyruvate/acetoin dehydrogenase alpha subunit